tara:strand:+ start:678 stop:1013 length:336 start_codon:yes stop_codon:yes gene_type:complete
MTLLATYRSSANIYQPISLRAVFSDLGVNQHVIIDAVLIRDATNKLVRGYGPSDVKRLKDGSYELKVATGLPAGDYKDHWSVHGVASSFRLTTEFSFTINTDSSGNRNREP